MSAEFPVFEILPPEKTLTRNLIVLLLDASGSMADPVFDSHGNLVKSRKVDALQEALDEFLQSGIHREPKLEINGEIAIFTFGDSVVKHESLGSSVLPDSPFHFVRNVKAAPKLGASGGTPMGQAVAVALEAIEARKESLRTSGITHEHRPNVFLLTDGKPSDDISAAVEYLHQEEREKAVLFWALGTEDCDRARLSLFADKGNYYRIAGNSIREFLSFVSKSMRRQAGVVRGDDAETIYADVKRNISLDMQTDRILGITPEDELDR